MLRLIQPTRTLLFKRWENARQAEEASPSALVLGGERANAHAPAWEVAVESAQRRQAVIIMSESAESFPMIVGDEWARCCWMGHEGLLYMIPDNLEKVRCWEADSPIATIRLVNRMGPLIVICETGVTAMGSDLSAQWSTPTDLITDHHWLDNGHLAIDQMDGPSIEVDLSTGHFKIR